MAGYRAYTKMVYLSADLSKHYSHLIATRQGVEPDTWPRRNVDVDGRTRGRTSYGGSIAIHAPHGDDVSVTQLKLPPDLQKLMSCCMDRVQFAFCNN